MSADSWRQVVPRRVGGKFILHLVRQFVLASRYDFGKDIQPRFDVIDRGLVVAERGHALHNRL